jgi:hypothetical protein
LTLLCVARRVTPPAAAVEKTSSGRAAFFPRGITGLHHTHVISAEPLPHGPTANMDSPRQALRLTAMENDSSESSRLSAERANN